MKRRAIVLLLLAGCGGGEERPTVYLKQHLGPEGPHSQIAPVLMPVEREPRTGIPREHQAILEIRVGPSPDERAHGFLNTIEPETRLRSVSIEGATATVEPAGRELDFYGAAAVVYSLTALPGVERVGLRLGGKPCCAHRHDGTAIAFLSRSDYAGWQGVPCAERDGTDALRCRG